MGRNSPAHDTSKQSSNFNNLLQLLKFELCLLPLLLLGRKEKDMATIKKCIICDDDMGGCCSASYQLESVGTQMR